MSDSQWDVILIGSGIASLTCGVLLARAGRRVLVLERYTKPGGYLHCFERYGHRFDTGAHYSGALGDQEPFKALLTYLGVYDDELFVPLAEDGFDVMQFRDFEVKMPVGYERTVAALSEAFPDDAAAVKEFYGIIRSAAASFTTYNFANLNQDDDRIAYLTATPLRTVVQGLTANPRLQCVFYAYCALHGVAPGDVSLGLHALVTDSLIRGAWGFKHGGERLAGKYLAALAGAGAEVRQDAGVKELRSDGRRITEVVLDDGSVHTATLVISGIHPKATFRLLSGYRPTPAFAARLGAVQETVGFLGVYAACRPPETFDRNRNYYFFDWSDPNAFDLLGAPDPAGTRPPLAAFVCRPDRVKVQAESKEGLYPVSIHSHVRFTEFAAWQGQTQKRKSRDYYARKLQLAQESIGFVDSRVPGFAAAVVRHDASTPLSNLRFNGSEEGTAYGIYHSIKNTGPRALGPRTHVENLLLTGQSCLFPGLLGAAVSGLRTAGNLIGMKNILRDLSPMVKL